MEGGTTPHPPVAYVTSTFLSTTDVLAISLEMQSQTPFADEWNGRTKVLTILAS